MVAEGDTDCVPDKGTEPIPWSIVTEVAPVTFQCSVEVPPKVILFGVAEKLKIAGAPEGGLTTTVASEVVEPYKLDAVSV